MSFSKHSQWCLDSNLLSPLQPDCWMGWVISICSIGFQPFWVGGLCWAFSERNSIKEHDVSQVCGEMMFWLYVECLFATNEQIDGP